MNITVPAKWQDRFNLLSKITLQKTVNALLVLVSYHVSRALKKSIHKGLPISMAIEPTTSCNLRCPECPSGLRSFTRPTGMLDELRFQSIINEIHKHLIYLTFYFQGEPYLNTRFLSMVAYAASKKIYTATSTNGHYLNDQNARATVVSGLNRLTISIDGATQETYQAYRVGGKLANVLEGTKNIIAWKKKLKSNTPHVIFQFLVVKHNQHELETIRQMGRELEVDEVVFKTAQIYDYENGSDLMPDISEYSRYRKTAEGKYAVKNSLDNSCWKMWNSCVVTWDGRIVPCCFDKDASHVLGNLNQMSLKAIWKGSAYERFRQALLRSRSEIDICKNCTEGTKVTAS